jgi:uncharacterized protein (TIGR02145 family)
MKEIKFTLILLIIALRSFAQIDDTIKDSRDGRVYKVIKIGSQVWMAENLNYTTDSGSWCYDNQFYNCDKYGRLYIWEIANKVCPTGWHLPSDEEWKELEKSLGMPEEEANSSGFRGEGSNIGGKLKSILNWKSPNLGATDEVGFNALPGGNYGTKEKESYFKGMNAMFYTSTCFGNEFAWYRDMDYADCKIFRGYRSKKLAFSIRCIKKE